MLNMITIGSKITELRKKQKLTQTDLAESLYVTHQAVSKWENGRSLPSIEILYEMTKLFNVSIDYLLDDTEILEHDYEAKLKVLPRDVVFNSYITSDSTDAEFRNIFYLLNQIERNKILGLIINKKIDIRISTIWPYLNDKERKYLLNVILSGSLKFDLNIIKHQLSESELQLLTYQQNGRYNKTHN